MQKLRVKKVRENLKEFYKRGALDVDGSLIVDQETIVYDDDTGEYVFGLFDIGRDPKQLVAYLNSIKFQTTRRTGGMLSTSRIFGYSPRVKIRADYCNKTSLSRENKPAHDYVCEYGGVIQDIYKKHAPEAYESHMEMTDKVLGDWKIKDTPFTSWIINKNNKLNYHYDAWNFKNVYSCMITLKDGIDGGYLMIPEYNIQVRTYHNSLFMFDGQSVLHGVSPIKRLKEDSYRYTIVYYSLKGMRQCLEPSGELERVKKEKTKLYQRRKDLLKKKKDEGNV